VKKKWWGLIGIIILAIFWRFWSFETRWVLNQDQARDAIIGLYALRHNIWPEIGSPSSAGPFNFGPWYDWLIMFWEKVIPTTNGPWIGFAIMSVISVVLYYFTGGWIAGVLAAMAVGQVENAPDMLNTVIVGFSCALAWWGTKKLIDSDDWRWGIVVGAGVGLSINFHFQSLGLLAILVAITIFNFRKIFGLGLGLLISFLPLIIFDIKRNGVWILSVIEYYTVGVNKFYVPVRWLTEIKDFWPQLWGNVTVGSGYFGYVWVVLGAIIIIFNLKFLIFNQFLKLNFKFLNKKIIKFDRFFMILMVTLLIDIFLMRNYKGVRSREYMIVFQGMIILLCSWIVGEYYKLNKYLGLLILGIIVVLAGVKNWQNIKQNPSQAQAILEIKKELDTKVEGQVEFEQFKQSDMISMPLFYLYYFENRIGNQNKLLICDGNRYVCPKGEIINKNKYFIYINSRENWDKLTAENIYDRLMVNYGKK